MNSIAEVVQVLKAANSVAVFSHYNPDPDAYGSSCGLGLALESLGKKVAIVNESGCSARYDFVPGAKRIIKTLPDWPLDVIVTCDCGDLKRVGDSLVESIKSAACVINIDHHHGNDNFGKYNLVDEHASSTSEMIFRLIDAMGVSISADVARALFAGIAADSGCFRYSSTSAETFAVAKRLVEAGARPDEVGRELYGRNSLSSVRLHAEALSQLRLHCDNRLSELVITEEVVKRCQAVGEDSDGLVDKARDIEGVQVAVLIRWDCGIWRISMRSKRESLDVSEVAREFGGGGHKSAAAFRWRNGLDELREKLLGRLAKLFE